MKNSIICELLGINYPIIQGGMAWASCHALAGAVSESGGLGLLGSSTMTPDELSIEIDELRKLTKNNFGVNIALMSPDPDEKVEICIQKKVPVVVTAAGSPKKFTDKLKNAGIIVGHVVPSLRLAKKVEEAGCDFVVAESTEAGGHDGIEEIANFTLIPLIKKNVRLPLVAAGGIVNGRQIAAAMLLGADGVQMGTRFVATDECGVHDNFKKAIVAADEMATLFVARKYKPQRILKNPFAEKIRDMEAKGASAEEIRDAYGAHRGRTGAVLGNWQEGYFNSGQGAVLIDRVLPVAEVMKELVAEFNTAVRALEAYK